MPVPIAVVPSNRVTVAPASAMPVKVGKAMLVMLSVLDTPLSDAASRSGCRRRGGRRLIEHIGLRECRADQTAAFSTRAISVLLPVSVTPASEKVVAPLPRSRSAM